MQEEIVYLSVFQIAPDPEQPRKLFKEEELKDLSDSIAIHGVISPIIVTPFGNGTYRIVAGERRWRASILAKQEKIPAIIRDLKPYNRKIQALLENIQRSDLNAMEEAQAYKNLQIEFHLSHEEIANAVGKSRSAVTNSLRLLNLPVFVQDQIIDGNISSGHAKLLMGLLKEEDVIYVAGKIVREQLSVKDTKMLIDKCLKRVQQPLVNDANNQSLDSNGLHRKKLEEKLTRQLATAVSIRWQPTGKGNISIDFNDLDELERLADIMHLDISL